MKDLFKQLRSYYIGSLTAIFVGLILLVIFSKVEGHMSVNNTHTEFQDVLFFYITYLGDGLFVLFAVLLLLVINRRRDLTFFFFLALLTMLFVGILVFLGKQVFFHDAFRPFKYLAEITKISFHRVPGVELHTNNSFPSGHTTAAFALFALVSYTFPKPKAIQIISLLIAILVGYSRIYLSQHFLQDVVTGAILGVGSFSLSYWIVNRFSSQ